MDSSHCGNTSISPGVHPPSPLPSISRSTVKERGDGILGKSERMRGSKKEEENVDTKCCNEDQLVAFQGKGVPLKLV